MVRRRHLLWASFTASQLHSLALGLLGIAGVSLTVTAALMSIMLLLMRTELPSGIRVWDNDDNAECAKPATKLPWINSSSEPALTDDSLIITRSVLILRRTSVYLKILLIKKCETDASRWRIMIDRAQIICPRIKHIESDECPWSWAPGCHWSSFIASAKLNSIPRHALVNFNNHSVALLLGPSHYQYSIQFAVCIKPLYWYVDWLQVVEFIETWLSQGVDHFFFYVYVVSHSVYKILEHYSKKGFVTMIPWGPFPSTTKTDPNEEVYRLAHSLADNDCLLRAESAHFVAFVDLDEYILTLSGTSLFTYLENKVMLCPACGSFFAIHRKLYYSTPRINDGFNRRNITFEWLKNVSYGMPEPDGPHKQIVRPETVSIIATHSIRKSYHGYIDVNVRHFSYRKTPQWRTEGGCKVVKRCANEAGDAVRWIHASEIDNNENQFVVV